MRRGGRDERICRSWCFRQIVVAVKTPTLAEKLGLSPHDSALLRKAAGLGLGSTEKLESLAVERGCWHYRSPDLVQSSEVPESDFTNEELALALLSPALPYSPHTIRVGAAMLGATDNDVSVLVNLAVGEHAVAPVRYIAGAALRFEPENPFWRQLLDRLPAAPQIEDGVMPHSTRFVSMTGMTRTGTGPVVVWIRPRPDLALTHG